LRERKVNICTIW